MSKTNRVGHRQELARQELIEFPALLAFQADLRICAFIKQLNPKMHRQIQKLPSHKQEDWFARFARENGRFEILLAGGGKTQKENNHLHLEINNHAHVKFHKRNKSVWQIASAIEPFFGQVAQLRIESHFFVPVRRLSKGLLEVALDLRVRHRGISVALIGGTFFVGGGPIRLIEWLLRRDMRECMITLRDNQEIKLSPSYVGDVQRRMRTVFHTVVLGE
ncbi:MAG: hypothetical protein ABSC42_07130 [Tepidisphaeraceae bacterium]